VIRFAIVDDHPAVRVGLEAALEDEPGLICVGSAEDEAGLFGVLHDAKPDVVLLDQQLPGADGVHICRRLKTTHPDLRILIVSAFASQELCLTAALAGADGVLDKAVRAGALREAVRTVVKGGSLLPVFAPDELRGAARRLGPEELPIFGMLLDGADQEEVAEVLGVDHRTFVQRLDRMLARLVLTG